MDVAVYNHDGEFHSLASLPINFATADLADALAALDFTAKHVYALGPKHACLGKWERNTF